MCAAVLGVLLAGCATTVPGTPSPVPGTAPPGVDLPPRPREVRLDGLDPCTLLTDDERTELGLERDPLLTALPSALYNGGVVQLCTDRGYEPRAITAGVLLSVSGGIELYLREGVPSDIMPIEVTGFPALVAVPTIDRFCAVVVDVAPGQVVDVSVSDGGRVPPVPQETLCQDARRLADLVMANLLEAR